MHEFDSIDRLIAESEPLEAFGIDDYADLNELRDIMQHDHDID
ncbi:MAG: hypothetical protein ACRD19_11550 [Terriglobia bacterium]